VDSMTDPNDQMRVRLQKIPAIQTSGDRPYADRFERTHRLHEAALLADNTAGVSVAGRVIALRFFGKLAFGHIYDLDGKVQFAVQKNKLQGRFDDFKNCVDI
jgi:lysyl-tRNA synthetase, class II